MRIRGTNGWIDIGKTCSAGRRSLWLKINYKPKYNKHIIQSQDVKNFELCAGREGADSYVCITPTNPQFIELFDLFLTAKFAAET